MNKTNFPQRITLCMLIILFSVLIVSLSATDKDNFQILSYSQNQIELKFNLGSWNLETKNENGIEEKIIVSTSKNNLCVDETETLPIYSAMIAIPDGMDVELVTDISRQQDLRNVNLKDKSAMIQGRGESGFYPQSQIVISEPGQFRDFRIANINVYPFQLDTRSNDLNVIEEANITLRFVPSERGYVNPSAGRFSPSFDKLYDALILNYRDLRDELVPFEQPVLLIIYPSGGDTNFNNKLTELVNWKKQKGYIVNTASTATTGTSTSSVKTYIQGQYNNVSTRPDVIMLIGDATGTYGVPSYSESMTGWTSYTSEGDYPYQLLAGGDLYGDAQIGRVSIDSSNEFSEYVAKIMVIERDIDIPTADWLNRMLLVGDYGSSGISTIYTNRYIHDISDDVNPSYTYTELYSSSPSVATMNSTITAGVGFYNYRGWLGMSGWSPGSTTNYNKLNHGVIITCGTGTFINGTATSESYIRQGSEALPTGGITAIGMATTGTHTAFNNTLSMAIFDGIFNHDMRTMGEALLFSKCNLQNVYGVSNTNTAAFFDRICNLMGDPTVEVWVAVPKSFHFSAPTSMLTGTTTLSFLVRDQSSNPLPNATINLWQLSSGLNITVYTDANGIAYFSLPSDLTGSLTMTASYHEYKPLIQTINITGTGLVYEDALIDDDTSGSSDGNNNGVMNAGESIEYNFQIKNTSVTTITGISGTLITTDPYITFTSSNTMTFPNAAGGSIVTSSAAVNFDVSPACPDNHQVAFKLNLSTSAGNFSIPVQHIVRAADLDYVSHTILGSNNYLEISETADMYVTVINNGSENATAVSGRIRSLHSAVTVNDSIQYFGNITSGSLYSNSGLPFNVSANASAITGMIIPMELILTNTSGYTETEYFTITIGNATQTDPLGQDEYGYYIFDVSDSSYPQCPTYNWLAIAPAEGGSGSELIFTDTGVDGSEGDLDNAISVQTVSLPFTFKFYGIDYNQITVCSNGFLAFGETLNGDFRNGRLPGPAGPNPMIAPFWDDLVLQAGSGIYTYYDAANHRYIVEWYQCKNGDNTSYEETFEVILLDPTYYPTSTGDGPIKIQYKVFNNVDVGSSSSHGNYSTVGIKNQTGTIGLEYSFNNQYPAAAQPLANEKALYITTADIPANEPFLAITQTNLVDTNGNGIAEPNETLDVRLTISNNGTVTANNVTCTITESDPWINITGNTASFGNIGSLGSEINTSGLVVNVLSGFPDGYIATINAEINCSGYTFNRTFTITLNTPVLSFGDYIIQDPTGNNNGRLDPGETVTLIISLDNTGGAPSSSGSATMTSSTPGITVTNGNDTFSAITGNNNENLSFVLVASSGMTIGTLATLEFDASDGMYSADTIKLVEIGAPLEVTIGTGSGTQSYPIDRYYNYSGHEAIYLASEIGIGGNIKSVAYYKASGSDVGSIEDVTIYMKNTSETTIASGAYSLTGYTQVYNGTYPNNATSGWMEVNLNSLFPYDGVSNLSILIIKGYQQYINNYPYWTYSTVSPSRARQNRSDSSQPITLTASSYLPNLKLKIYQVEGFLYPPQNLVASPSFQSVRLDWQAPVSGTPTGYKIYKNSALLTTVTALTYTDLVVTNGTTYSYYVIAAYNEGDSSPTLTVNATPDAIAPSNLTSSVGNGFVNLSWNGASGREEVETLRTSDRSIIGYKIYRNSSLLNTVSETSYNDTSVINETTYTYYVTTAYSNPTGESEASNEIQATPSANVPVVAILGTGTSISLTNYISPINLSYRSIHGQSVYTATELNAAGVSGPINITQFGFNIGSSPTLALPNFVIRMKHTSDTNAANWQSENEMVTVYTNTAYMPVEGGYDMITLSTPFTWNGIDNIVIDTAFSPVSVWSHSGTVQYTTITNGYRAAYSDTEDQSAIYTGGNTFSRRPNIRLIMLSTSQLDSPVVSIEKTTLGSRISWMTVSGAARYLVYASTEPEGGFAQIAEVTTNEYVDTTINNYRFYYVIAADGAAARETESNN